MISSTGTTAGGDKYVDVSTSGLAVADEDFNITTGSATVFALTSPSDDEPTVEAFFEGSHPVHEGAQESYSSQSIIIREKQGSTATTQKGAFVVSDWKIQNGNEAATNNDPAILSTNLSFLGLEKLHRPMEITAASIRHRQCNHIDLE